MAEEEPKPEDLSKWEGKTRVELKGAKSEQVWPFLEDFCNLHKIFPCIDTCYYLEGELGNPGMIRYCAATTSPSFGSASLNDDHGDDNDRKLSTKWAKEKLLSINPGEKWLSYEVLENNVGFKSYVSTIKVLSSNGDVKGPDGGGNEEQACWLEWAFVSDPIQGWRAEDFDAYVQCSLQSIANRIQEILQSPIIYN